MPSTASGNVCPKPQQQVVGQVPPNNHVQTQAVTQILDKLVPIQITLPAQPGTETPGRVLTIEVPGSALQGNQLQKVLTGPIISTTMNLPQNVACMVLQHHVNTAFTRPLSQPPQMQQIVRQVTKPVSQSDGPNDIPGDQNVPSTSLVTYAPVKLNSKLLTDGPTDSSDDDDDASDADGSDGGEEKDDDDQEIDDDEGPEEDPLNSEDDVSDEDPDEIFDTDNVVVCQYDKVTMIMCVL